MFDLEDHQRPHLQLRIGRRLCDDLGSRFCSAHLPKTVQYDPKNWTDVHAAWAQSLPVNGWVFDEEPACGHWRTTGAIQPEQRVGMSFLRGAMQGIRAYIPLLIDAE